MLAAFLKLLMPVIIVLPGIAAVALAPNLARPDEAYPHLMAMLPTGMLGLVFAALIAAIVASMGSKINSIATIFTMDVYRPLRPATSQQRLVLVGRIDGRDRAHHRDAGRPSRCSAASTRRSSTSRSSPASSRRASA